MWAWYLFTRWYVNILKKKEMPSGLLWRAYGILPFSTQFNSFALIWPLFSMRMGLVQNLIFGANTFWALFKINDIPQYPFIRKRDQPSPVGFLKNHPISDSQCFLIFHVLPVTISWLFLELRIVICHILHQRKQENWYLYNTIWL